MPRTREVVDWWLKQWGRDPHLCVDWKTENSVDVVTKLPPIQKLGEAVLVRDTGAVTMLAFLRPTASQCTSRGTLWVHRLPSHISKMVVSTVRGGGPCKTELSLSQKSVRKPGCRL